MRTPPFIANDVRARRLWAAVLVALLVGSACTGSQRPVAPGTDEASAPGGIRELSSIATLQEQFDRDEGMTRLILLISPT